MKPGTKLKSAVCDTEVMVIRSGAGTIECGGSAMGEAKPETVGTPAADFSAARKSAMTLAMVNASSRHGISTATRIAGRATSPPSCCTTATPNAIHS